MTQASSTTTLMILGESDVGKTHYGAQLLLRLNKQSGALRMRAAPSNLAPFESALQCLNEGRPAEHTATPDFLESRRPIKDQRERPTDLLWPDYGGEQIRQIIDHRRISASWKDRLSRSDGWILFVRIQHMTVSADLFSRPLAALRKLPEVERGYKISDQARLVELLQLLLYVRGVGTLSPISFPALTVLLSCWDELGAAVEECPAEVLTKRLPLLADFVMSNWRQGHSEILGLSALGRPLKKEAPDEDYVNRGPEHFGYVVRADGSRDTDLTVPVANLAALIG